jgi:ribonucleoside-diphosphate reductase alpha chain
MSIVNQTVPRALKALGYSKKQTSDIIAYIDSEKTILGAPHLKKEHEPVFACSMGDNAIHYLGHVKMMSAVQPFLSGAISQTVNMPEDATIEDVEQIHIDSWKMGLKAVAIYRDNCKVAQPLSMAKKESEEEKPEVSTEAEVENIVEKFIVKGAVRRELPKMRTSKTFSFKVADSHGYMTVGEYDDGTPGEIFMRLGKQGSTLAGFIDAFAISVSHGLQFGVPLRDYVKSFTSMTFAPSGITDDDEIRTASSLIDYMFRRLALSYLSFDDRLVLGLASIDDMPDQQTTLLEQSMISEKPSITAEPKPEEPKTQPIEAVISPSVNKSSALVDKVAKTVNDSTAPLCYNCGNQTQRSGSCYVCTSCGSTTGCS